MQTKSITVYANYKDIRLPSMHLRELLSANRVNDEIIGACELALQELLTNLVDHAYEGDGSQPIIVNLYCDNAQVKIETQDLGKGMQFDPNNVNMPNPMDMAEGGYGVAIIQSLMDEMKYSSENGMNTWQLVKYL